MRDLKGRDFGKWRVVGPARKTSKSVYWLCRCACGAVKEVRDSTLMNGESAGCGAGKCHHSYKHGSSGYNTTKAYAAWQHMIQRCTNPNTKEFHRYGGRGIKICERWDVFTNFLEDMGNPTAGMTLDRKDSDGDYSPGNCNWATRLTQGGNTCRVIRLEYHGETRSIRAWSKHIGIPYGALRQRIKNGWDIEKALTSPIDERFIYAKRKR